MTETTMTKAEEDLAKRKAVGISLAALAFDVNESKGPSYDKYLTMLEEAKQWDWEPGDPEVRAAYNKQIHMMLVEEGILVEE